MSRNELLESDNVYKSVIKLAVPTVLSSLVMIAYNLADTYFVGMLNDPVQNAAVSLAAPLLLAFNAVNNLFGVGSSSMMSRALGRGDMEQAHKSSAFGFYGALLFSVLFAVLSGVFKNPVLTVLGVSESTREATGMYMQWTVICGAVPSILNVVLSYMVRAEGKSMHASIGVSCGCILNIILDPFFALPFGLDMGAQGVGMATFISNCVACLYFFIIIYRSKKETCIRLAPRYMTLERSVVTGVFGVGISAAIQNLLNVTGMTILNNCTAAYGTNAVAAMGIAQKVSIVPMYILMGVSQGVAPLVGYKYAQRKFKNMRQAVTFATYISVGFSALSVAVLLLWGEPISSIFIQNEEIITYSTGLLKGLSIALPFLCMDFMAVCVFQAIGNGKAALLFAIMRKVVLEIPALLLLNYIFGMYGLTFGQVVAEVILALAAVIILVRFFQKNHE